MKLTALQTTRYADVFWRLANGDEALGATLLALPEIGEPEWLVDAMTYDRIWLPELIEPALRLASEVDYQSTDPAPVAATLIHEIEKNTYPPDEPYPEVAIGAFWMLGSLADLAAKRKGL